MLLPTHTTRHLASSLYAIAFQTDTPDGVVLTCDTDDVQLIELARSTWLAAQQRCPQLPSLLVSVRPHTGEPRLNQVRNNGLRALDSYASLSEEDLVVIVDGDTVLEPEAIRKHRGLVLAGHELIVPYRVDLTPQETPAFHEDRLIEQGLPAIEPLMTDERVSKLDARRARYRKQLRLKRLPIASAFTKRHKPKFIGGHHAASVRVLRAINGYDEMYVGYGYDDDDLSRRAYDLRPFPKTQIAVGDIHAFHLYHPTRAPGSPTEAPGFRRFSRNDLPTRAEAGWDSPREQPEPEIIEVQR